MRPLLALAILLPILPISAQAHFAEDVPDSWGEWAMRQISQGTDGTGGQRCCDPTDAHLYNGRYEYNFGLSGFPDGVTLFLDDGRQIHVPQYRMMLVNPDDPNPTGTSVWWYVSEDNTYCFGTPGALG